VPGTVRQKCGATLQLSVTLDPVRVIHRGVTWTTSNPAVATVDQNGKVTCIQEGTTEIKATTENGHIAMATITVNNRPSLYFNAYA
jgi:uncharacterized protein YjdB